MRLQLNLMCIAVSSFMAGISVNSTGWLLYWALATGVNVFVVSMKMKGLKNEQL